MTSLEEQLVKYLTDAHAIEQQALVQLRWAPKMAGDPELARTFETHLAETERHESLVRERLGLHGADPSQTKDLGMQAGGLGFALFAKAQPDTPGKLVAHAYSYEHLELAAYELLARVATRIGDNETAGLAQFIRNEEQAMAERLAESFGAAAEASLNNGASQNQLVKYLADARAIEQQSLRLLEKAKGIGELDGVYDAHIQATAEHQRLLEGRLEANGSDGSAVKNAAMQLGAINWGLFFQAQPDTPGKLAAFAYAFEHLEAASYGQLGVVAERAGDAETVQIARRIRGEEHAMASRLSNAFDQAVDASLEAD